MPPPPRTPLLGTLPAERHSGSEIITPKLVCLPMGGPGLLRNSICCQQPDPHCSETRFAANTTLGKRQVSPPNSHGEILGGAQVLRVAFADVEKALVESLCQRENPTTMGESDRQELIQRKSPRFWNLRVPSSKFQQPLSGRFLAPVREGLQLVLLVHRPSRP